MSQSRLLHFDSIYGSYNQQTNTTSGVSSSPYNCSFSLPAPIRNVRRIYLKSAEIPVTFTNVRVGSTNTLKLIVNGTSYTLTLSEKLYTSISALLADINTAAAATIVANTPTFAVTSSTTTPYRVTITSAASTLVVVDTNLSRYMLGLRSTDTFSGGVLTGSANYNLSVDNYLNFSISSLPASSQNVNGSLCTFKIPLNATNNSIFYYLENSCFQQWVDVQDPNYVFSGLTVAIKDRFGNDINPQGGDHSFSLKIDYDL